MTVKAGMRRPCGDERVLLLGHGSYVNLHVTHCLDLHTYARDAGKTSGPEIYGLYQCQNVSVIMYHACNQAEGYISPLCGILTISCASINISKKNL